ncbi:iron chelate uptake ABC transporter family permease subunit [Isoptericola sp. BMS4]|uniref:FecCD family ABC transporter permease n=1 Tax=Isoptericola sp. BMS4 TaxID=2527875 RepID=UPI001F0EBE9F|nr:iron chelate uptake ABC transporter family permease subunit [Isoptericola sp. BMS4]
MRSGRRWVRAGTVLAVPYQVRTARVLTALALVLVALAAATLALGDLGLSPADALAALRGDAGTKTTFVLERIRGPRLLVGAGVGVALGLSGALFQTVTRNPLGSPDVIGLGAGAGAGVAVFTLLVPGSVPAPVGAVVGAVAAIGLVYLATGTGFSSPARLIVTGIGVAAMATAVTQYVVAVMLRDQGAELAAYVVGSLGSRSMEHVAQIAVALVVLVPCVAMLAHRLAVADMGDPLTDALGARSAQTRTLAIVLSVLLSAAAVAVSGPITFVALAAPHVARMLTRAPGPNLAAAAVTGAVLVVGADLLVQHVPFLEGLPVGVVTGGLGGLYLGYLLTTGWKRTR